MIWSKTTQILKKRLLSALLSPIVPRQSSIFANSTIIFKYRSSPTLKNPSKLLTDNLEWLSEKLQDNNTKDKNFSTSNIQSLPNSCQDGKTFTWKACLLLIKTDHWNPMKNSSKVTKRNDSIIHFITITPFISVIIKILLSSFRYCCWFCARTLSSIPSFPSQSKSGAPICLCLSCRCGWFCAFIRNLCLWSKGPKRVLLQVENRSTPTPPDSKLR